MSTFSQYLREFDERYRDTDSIKTEFYSTLWVGIGESINAKTRDTKWNLSEEYVRARFVYAMVYSGMYQKEYMCVEFGFPMGNTKKTLNPDIAVFKHKNWKEELEKAKSSKNYRWFSENTLAFLETKKSDYSVEKAIEQQLRPAMQINTSKDRIFGIYFDDQRDILIFKKIDNSEIRRFDERKELHTDGINGLNIDKRDTLIDLPSQKDLTLNNESISDIEKLKLDSLDAIDEEIFKDTMNLLKRENDKIHPKSPVQSLIVEFLTLKVFDEKRSQRQKTFLQFYILPEEKTNLKSFRERIARLYQDAKKEYSRVLSKPLFAYSSDMKPSDSGDEKFLIALVEVFQKRAILKAKNESFNQIIFNNFWENNGENGQFFTPVPIVKNIIKLLNPRKWEELCDPCCGICDFPAMAFRHAHRHDADYPDIASHYYGFDLEASNLKLAELNLVLNGDGGATLEQMNSLSQKFLWNGEKSKEWFFTSKSFDPITWKNTDYDDEDKNIKQFDIIATNPPFGKWRDLKTGDKWKWDQPKEVVELYETWKVKRWEDGEVPNSMDMWVLFLENAMKVLRPGGRMGIVVSNSIASIKEWENVRKWFMERMRIVALFDLPSNTFGETGVATTIIIAYKPKYDERYLLTEDYEVFVKEIENIGYEVKTVNRTIHFAPQYIINEETFEKTSDLLEDFSTMQRDFTEYLKRQEESIKKAFWLDNRD